MASGYQTTGTLSDSLDTMVAAARATREYDGVMSQLVDTVTLEEGTGLTYKEVVLGKLTAQAVTETTELDNPQQVSDSAFTVTPTMCGIHTVITDRVRRRLNKKAFAKLGRQAQQAMQRKKDEDLLVVLDGGQSLSGAGTTLVSGVISAATVRITSNTTEPGKPPINCVLHGFQLKDLADELVAGIGSENLQEGPTAEVYRRGFRLPISGTRIFEDGNITIDSSDDAKGGVFSKEGILLVQGKTPWRETRREPQIGGGADAVWLYDEYAAAERLAANTTSGWIYEIYSDATTPSN